MTIRRELATTNPAFRPDLAVSLNNLGIRYSELGRRDEALPPTEEAVTILPRAGDDQPRLPPRSGRSLNNLGIATANWAAATRPCPPQKRR